jgi:hypothetical protein
MSDRLSIVVGFRGDTNSRPSAAPCSNENGLWQGCLDRDHPGKRCPHLIAAGLRVYAV